MALERATPSSWNGLRSARSVGPLSQASIELGQLMSSAIMVVKMLLAGPSTGPALIDVSCCIRADV
eukprot:3631779-Amphidinium_carterae.1